MGTPLILAVLAVFVQVGLTAWAMVRMGMVRVDALKQTDLKLGDVSVDTTGYPDRARRYANNVSNQFETPVLLYALVALGAGLNAVTWWVALAALMFVLSRLMHRHEHVGRNDVRARFAIFSAGFGCLCFGWLALGWELVSR